MAENEAQEAAPEAAPESVPTPVETSNDAPEVEAGEAAEQTPEDLESQEWDDAVEENYPGSKNKENKDEPAKPEEGDEAAPEAEASTEEADGEEKPEEEAQKPEAERTAEAAARAARLAARESKQQVDLVKSDVRDKLFKDVPTKLLDAEGDEIKSVEDVQSRINPRTGENFTEEEATLWLSHASQQLKDSVSHTEAQVEQIADTNVALKDEADEINDRYGEVLKANPELRDRLWAEFEKTLEKDAESGIITKAPVSLAGFYDVALSGYVTQAKAAQETAEQTEAARVAAEAAKVEADRKKQQHRTERSDIYAPNNAKITDESDKEWEEAIKETYPHLGK